MQQPTIETERRLDRHTINHKASQSKEEIISVADIEERNPQTGEEPENESRIYQKVDTPVKQNSEVLPILKSK